MSLKNRGLIPIIQREADFSQARSFPKVLDKVELVTYMEFQKNSMTGCRDIGKNIKMPPQNVFSPFCDPQSFFVNNWSLSVLYPYGAQTSCETRQVYNGPRVVKFIST